MVKIFQKMIRIYAYLVSPLIGQSCRYQPTCSAYAHEALERHGVTKGLYLTMRRVLSCHPWCKHHFQDPVPERFAWRDILRYKRLVSNCEPD